MRYHYFFGTQGDCKCHEAVTICEGTSLDPRIIMLRNGEMYEKFELPSSMRGGHGQCSDCAFGAHTDKFKNCPPIHGCSPDLEVRCRIYTQGDTFVTEINPGKTTAHVHWKRFYPKIIDKIDVRNVEI